MKPLFIISCPIDTYSGYGSRSRDLVKAIIELDKYDVKILPQRWGGTPWGFIQDNPEWEFLTKHILNGQIPRQPEIWAQVTIPNEFQPIGKFNIGFTAGIETTVCNPTWVDGLNRMDLNIVSSKHAKDVFLNAKFEERNQKQKPALILKASILAGASYVDREEILKRIKQIRKTVASKDLPNIYLLHGEFKDEEINELYNHPKVKAMINLTKGEGFGRPLLEFTQCKKPIITTAWSGHTDFLDPQMSVMMGGQLTPVHPSVVNDWVVKDSQWFSVDQTQVGHYLKDVFENYKNYTDGAKRQAYKAKTEFSWDKMKEKIGQILEGNVPDFPKQVELKLPSIKKIELPKKPTLQNG